MQRNVLVSILSIFFIALLPPDSFSQAKQDNPNFQHDFSTSDSSNFSLNAVFDQNISDSIQIVALGEVSHGGYGPIAFKCAMIKYLIEKKNFRKILFEQSDIVVMRPMRNYLNNLNSSDSSYITNWVNNGRFTQAIRSGYLDLFKWIKNYNLKHPNGIVEVRGFEIETNKRAVDIIVNNYIIPYDIKESQKLVYKLNAHTPDAEKVEMLNHWFSANESALKAKLDEQRFKWLHFYVRNIMDGLNYLMKDSEDISKNPLSNLFRDSVLAENVVSLAGKDRSIIWAHNGHVIRSKWKFMGTYLDQYYKLKYYIIATDFSNLASIEVAESRFADLNKVQYLKKTFKSDISTAASQILKNYGISSGIFFSRDLIKMKVGNATNILDANGLHILVPSFEGSLDALVIFDNIYPDNYFKYQ